MGRVSNPPLLRLRRDKEVGAKLSALRFSSGSIFCHTFLIGAEGVEVVVESGDFGEGAGAVGGNEGIAEVLEEGDVVGGGGVDGAVGKSGGLGAVVGNEAGEGCGDSFGEVVPLRAVGADVAVHLLRGEGDVEIVGNEGSFFIREMEIRLAEVGEEEAEFHAQKAEGGVPTPCGIIHRITHPLCVLHQHL